MVRIFIQCLRLAVWILNGDSRSYMAGGVDTWKLGLRSMPGVDDGTTLPDTDRPFIPNGTGGFRTAKMKLKKKIPYKCCFCFLLFYYCITYPFHLFFQSE